MRLRPLALRPRSRIRLAFGGPLPGGTPPAPPDREVRVAAAADLKFALDAVFAATAASTRGIRPAVTYGSSGSFYAQIENGAPFDLFLSADAEYPRRLAAKGLADGEPFLYAVGRIALWVPASSKLDLGALGLRALLDPSVRKVAIANPRHAPYGRAAEAAMKSLGILRGREGEARPRRERRPGRAVRPERGRGRRRRSPSRSPSRRRCVRSAGTSRSRSRAIRAWTREASS